MANRTGSGIHLRPIHPFAARMAPEVIWDELPEHPRGLVVLDPMAGSGTTLVGARLRGHRAIGFDRDPLAVLIANVWVTDMDAEAVRKKAEIVLVRARKYAAVLPLKEAYPRGADDETKAFVRYWFDNDNRIELTALARTIGRLQDERLREILWCAFSRLIITKQAGVSRAMDLSHSRPHRVYDYSPIGAFDHFGRAVEQILAAAPFADEAHHRKPVARMQNGDARRLPLEDESVDVIITSPPYLNAIDYLRGHKFSLIWMGRRIGPLRELRATNVGSEVKAKNCGDCNGEEILKRMCRPGSLSSRQTGMLRRYVADLQAVISETFRVLRHGGRSVFVIGNCNLRDTFIENSEGIEGIAEQTGLLVHSARKRLLPENRRYLPPPGARGAGKALHKRMREEVVLTLLKP